MNYNQLHSEINVLGLTAWAVAFARLKNERERRSRGRHRDIQSGKWMPGEVLRRKIAGKQNNSRKYKQSVGECELSEDRERSEVGDRENLNYSADSHNTRTWPSQLTGNSGGEISFFPLVPTENLYSIKRQTHPLKELNIPDHTSDCK